MEVEEDVINTESWRHRHQKYPKAQTDIMQCKLIHTYRGHLIEAGTHTHTHIVENSGLE
uniref:Uncharacterized protein n=1 Tax=Octopus bimaculoides TaxID=37653 RepID=A0A0L8IG18_OCTBM